MLVPPPTPFRQLRSNRVWPWLVVLSINAFVILIGAGILVGWPHDWGVFEQIPRRLTDGSLYRLEPGYNFVWSPAAAWIITLAVVPLGFYPWFVVHAMCLALLRDRRLIALAACSLPLWIDAGLGNAFVFVFVAGVFALRGSRLGELTYLALFVLIPRPVALPLAIWLLWRERRTRAPFAAMAVLVATTAIASGYLDDWVGAMTSLTAGHISGLGNAGPTRFLGVWWLIAGIPLAIWLTAKRRFGLAGLALSPYIFPQYLLVALWDTLERQPAGIAQTSSGSLDKIPRSRALHRQLVPPVGMPQQSDAEPAA